MRSPLRGWRLPLRLASRDILRYKGRSALAALLILVPVLAMAAVLTFIRTYDVDGTEETAQHLRSAGASVSWNGQEPTTSTPFPAAGRRVGQNGKDQPTTAQVAKQAHASVVRESDVTVRATPSGPGAGDPQDYLTLRQTDLGSPVIRPTVHLDSGRLPRRAGEIVVTKTGRNSGLPGHGTITLTPEPSSMNASPPGATARVSVVGTVTTSVEVAFMGPPLPAFAPWSTTPTFLVAGPEWPAGTMRQWQSYGATVETRSHPEQDGEVLGNSPGDQVNIAIGTIGFVAVTALLAGPAFAAGATRQRRTLGLVVANGAPRSVLRRIILTQALLLGSVTAATGAVLGGATGSVIGKIAHLRHLGTPAPTDVPVRWLVALVVVSTIAALIAAAVPARAAGRTNLLAALRGQVSPRVVRRRWPLIGVGGVGLGTLCLLLATSPSIKDDGTSSVLLSYLGVPLFFGGAVLAVPYLLRLTEGFAAHLPVTARIAVRDVSRQRTRATAAVSAVLATVAALCAVGIFASSEDASVQKNYAPLTARGSAVVDTNDQQPLFGASGPRTVAKIKGIEPHSTPIWAPSSTTGYPQMTDGTCHDGVSLDSGPDAGLAVVALSPTDIAHAGFDPRAKDLLEHHGALVFSGTGHLTVSVPGQRASPDLIRNGQITLRDQNPKDSSTGPKQSGCRSITWRARAIGQAPPHIRGLPEGTVIVDRAELDRSKIRTGLLRVSIDPVHPLSKQRENQLSAVLPAGTGLYVERGYRSPMRLILTALTVGFGIIVLLTTVVSALLNDAESRADMATLAAVGAPNGIRRRIVGAHAATIGLVGAALGTLVGFVPGLVLARAATTESSGGWLSLNGTYVVPWWNLLVMLAVVPVLAAVISMTFARRTPTLTRREA